MSTFREGLRTLVSLCDNFISIVGLVIVAVSTLLIVTFIVFSLITTNPNPYFDIVGYMVLPGVLVMGLLIVPVGVYLKYRRRLREAADPDVDPVAINLRDRRIRGAALVFSGATFLVVLPILAVSGYEGYHYTESTEFCAKVCHTVMEPQGVAHASSPHARVRCAACHIGEGAGWFVKSKLSGTRQVFAVWLNTYSRPIPPAITELRPARETCEECHWPAKFFGSQLKEYVHYSPDEANSRRVVRAILKVGGADESIGRVEGIHMHMITEAKIQYVASDEHLQDIRWVKHIAKDGTEEVYRSDGLPADAPPPEGIVRTVDCMDCHNRGAHHFRPPARAIDLELEAGRIDRTLPFIKRESVKAMLIPYDSVEAAEAGIRKHLMTFYAENYPEILKSRGDAVEAAVSAVQAAYRRNNFPYMRVNWQSYPENIGHMMSSGCFRCHDGRHVSDDGRAISSSCETCHTFLTPVEGQPNIYREGPFVHSFDLDPRHSNLRCEQCHNGGLLLLCRDCHDQLQGLAKWTGRDLFRPANPPAPLEG
ncbi:MAG: cytochrome C, partial [Planctomycetota bacterium]